MKLYNLLEDIIFEDIKIISEGVSMEQIEDAIDSHRRIRISYQGEIEKKPETRYIDVYAVGTSKAGNEVIRVYQSFGYSTKKDSEGWKLLRTDRILRWEPTKFYASSKALDKISGEIGVRNTNGDRSMSSVSHWNNTPRFGDDGNKNEPIQNVQHNSKINTNNKQVNKINTNKQVNKIEPTNINKQVNNVEPNKNKITTGTKPSRYED